MEGKRVPQFVIRKATVDDTEAIRRMHAASWLATYPNDEHGVPYDWVKEYTDNWLTPEHLEKSKIYFGKAMDDPNGFYRVAESDGEIVGFVHAATNEDESKELKAIYTRPDMFGSGLGHQLMQSAAEWIGEAQANLEVAVYNQRAICFYEKYGFRKVPGTEYLYRDKIPVIKMIREVSNEV